MVNEAVIIYAGNDIYLCKCFPSPRWRRLLQNPFFLLSVKLHALDLAVIAIWLVGWVQIPPPHTQMEAYRILSGLRPRGELDRHHVHLAPHHPQTSPFDLKAKRHFFLETPPLGEIDFVWKWRSGPTPRGGYF